MADNIKKTLTGNESVNTDLSDQSRSFVERIDEVRSLVEENLHYVKSIKQGAGSLPASGGSDIEKTLNEILEISKANYDQTRKIRRWIAWQKFWEIFKLAIIIIPIVVGIIYLKPLLSQMVNTYQQLLNPTAAINLDNVDTKGLLDQINSQLKK